MTSLPCHAPHCRDRLRHPRQSAARRRRRNAASGLRLDPSQQLPRLGDGKCRWATHRLGCRDRFGFDAQVLLANARGDAAGRPMTAWGHSRRFGRASTISGLPQQPTFGRALVLVGKGQGTKSLRSSPLRGSKSQEACNCNRSREDGDGALMPEASPMNSRRFISLPPNKGTVS